jgi:hypothetical protein
VIYSQKNEKKCLTNNLRLDIMKLNNQTRDKKMTDFINETEFSQEGENTMSDFDALLDTNKKKKTPAKAKKSSAEIIPAPAAIQAEIDALIAAKKAKKIADSDIKKAEPTIIDFGIKLKDEKAYSGKFQKSYKIGNDENHVNMVTANKWSFKEDDVDEIKDLLGDKADDMLIEEKEVRLKAEVFSNDELKKKFVEMVGRDFPEFFETVVSHHVSEDFDEKVYELGQDTYEDLKLLMKQSKPSLR